MKKKENYNSKLGLRLKKLRIAKKMTQEELASEIYVSATQVYKYETGRAKIPEYRAEQIGKVFDINPQYLLNEEEEYPNIAVEMQAVLAKCGDEQKLLYSALISLLKLNGYDVTISELPKKASIEKRFELMKKHFTVSKGGKELFTLSMGETSRLGNSINDLFMVLLKRYYL